MTIEGKHNPLDIARWQRILTIWRSEVGSDIELFGNGLLTNVKLHDSKSPTGRAPVFAWWEKAQAAKLTPYSQHLLNNTPDSIGIAEQVYSDPKGPRNTVKYLWRHRPSVNDVAAILCCASLFSTLFSCCRNELGERRAPHDVQMDVHRAAVSQWYERPGIPWLAASASALPESDFFFRKVMNIEGLAADLAREHLTLLHEWRPIVITYETEG